MKTEKDLTFKLVASNDSVSDNLALTASRIPIKKSADIPKDRQIKLNEDTLFEFDCFVEDDHLTLELSEIDALAPFIYIKDITMPEIIKAHKMFKACDDLDEVCKHIQNLFKDRKIILVQNKDDEIILKIKAWHISDEVPFDIIAKREMTENKEGMLLKLYDIQKKQLELLKELENFVKAGNVNSREVEKKIKEIKEKFGNL